MSSPDVVAAVLLWTGLLLLAAWSGGWRAERLRQPAVLGELLAGIIVAAPVTVDAGLAPIVGAFAAGIALSTARKHGSPEPGAAQPWDETSHDPLPLRVAVRGLAAALVPLFFVEMGRRVDLRAADSGSAPVLLAALIVAAVIGKLASGLAAPRGARLSVGIGMIPRGEVGLIFAGIGRTLAIVDEATTSTPVLVVLATTLVAPPLLRWRLG